MNFFMSAESARLPSAQHNVSAEARPVPQPRPSGEDVRRGASPAVLGALVNRVNNLLSGQASAALSVSLRKCHHNIYCVLLVLYTFLDAGSTLLH